MKLTSILIFLLSFPVLLCGQNEQNKKEEHFPRHYLSINPLNMIAFQQIGLTYEYKPGIVGVALSGGYIYPNNAAYSNWFIAGPIEYGSLGYYSGYFLTPQVNVYLNKPKNNKQANLFYLSLKGVYKNMNIDTTTQAVWENLGDGYLIYRKMNDEVNIYSGFIDFGYKFVTHRFFFEINSGMGFTRVIHHMYTVAKGFSHNMEYYNPPKTGTFIETQPAFNFTINLGIAL